MAYERRGLIGVAQVFCGWSEREFLRTCSGRFGEAFRPVNFLKGIEGVKYVSRK
jgi:hypothetical protein